MKINLKESFEKKNVIKNGHFKLTSGNHSDTYINKDSIFCIPELFESVIIEMSYTIKRNFNCDIITGPAIAGAVLAAPVSNFLSRIFVYPEKIDGKMVFRRGYDKILEDARVVIIEDIITTGGSIEKTIKAIHNNRAHVEGIIAIWNRTNWDTGICPTISLINEHVMSWTPESCPLCADNIPLQDPKDL